MALGQRLVVRQARLLERVRERIVADVVQQGGESQSQQACGLGTGPRGLCELRQRAARQVVRAERMLEARMGGAGIYEESVTELTHVPQSLKRR